MQLLHRDAWPRWARAATSPSLISPFLVVALAIGGFTAYGAWTRAHPTHYARGGDAFGVDSLLASPSASRAGERARSGEPARSRRWRPARRSGRSRRPAGARQVSSARVPVVRRPAEAPPAGPRRVALRVARRPRPGPPGP